MHRIASLLVLVLLVGCGEDTPPVDFDMAQQQTYSAVGLYTYPNPLSEIPDGAFSRADNAVIRREGIIETRRGFRSMTASLGAAGNRFTELADFTGTLVGHTSAGQVATYNGTAWSALSGTYTPPTGRKMRFLQTGKSLYFTTDEGVKRLDEVGGSVYDAGIPQATGGTVALSSNGAHATGTVTLTGGAGNVTVTVGGTAVGPVAFVTSDAQTALATITALNNNATVAALVTASSGGSGIILLTAVQGGTVGNTITLTASRTAGAATASGPTLTGGLDGSGWFTADAQTAYRFVWGFRNVNDRIILGAPSGRLPLTNPSTETADTVVLTVQVPSWVTAEHFLQVYRSDTSAADDIPASDDMGLVYEAYPTASELTARVMSITDITPDELKGAPLYSSPNLGIPGSEKFQPPVCTDLTEYKERMWCAKTEQRQRIALTLLSVDSTSGGLGTGYSLSFTLDGEPIPTEQYIASTTETYVGRLFKRYTDGTASQNVAATAQSLVRVINATSQYMTAYYISGEYDSPGQILVEAKDLGAGTITVEAGGGSKMWIPAMRATFAATAPGAVTRAAGVLTVQLVTPHGLAAGDSINLTSISSPADQMFFTTGVKVIASTPTTSSFTVVEAGANYASIGAFLWQTLDAVVPSDSTAAANGVAFSEYGEPDAVPLGHYLTVGSPNFDVLRIIPLGDTLFIFKQDGVFVLTGDTPETFSTRAYPTAARLVAPDSVVVVGNSIYALTDQGVIAFSEAGPTLISRPIEGTLNAFYAGNAALKTATAATAFGVAYETEREYHLFLPASPSSVYATQAYVYNYATRAWTRWSKNAYTGYVLPSDGREYLGRADSNVLLQERKARTVADYEDEDGEAISMALDWQVRLADNPSGYKHWKRATVMLEPPGPANVTMSFGTEVSSSRGSGVMSTATQPYISSYIPVDQSRSQSLTVGVEGGEAQKLLAIRGLSVDVNIPSSKLR